MEFNIIIILVVSVAVVIGMLFIFWNKKREQRENERFEDYGDISGPEAVAEPPSMGVPENVESPKHRFAEQPTMVVPTDFESPELGDENFAEPVTEESEGEPEIEVVDDINFTRPKISLETDFTPPNSKAKPPQPEVSKIIDETLGEIDVYVNDEIVSTHKIADREIKIGRDPSQSHIIIPELIVSKLHCTLFSRDDRVFIKDNRSTNGLFIGEEKVTEKELIKDTVVSLGRRGTVKIRFRKN
jgi:hypothetical protein